MAAAEQLKELGEKLDAASADPADALAKLLEVRWGTPEAYFLGLVGCPRCGGVRSGVFRWICG